MTRAAWGESLRSGAIDFGWLFLGRVVLAGASAATMLLLARHLSLPTYGLFTIMVSAQLLLSRLVLLGLDSGMLRLRTVPDLRHRSQEVVQAGLVVLRGTGGAVALVALAAVALGWWTPLRWPAWMILAIASGAIGVALVDYASSYWRARLQFRAAALLQGGTALGRLGLTVAALGLMDGYPPLVFLAYTGASLGSGVLQTIGLTRRSGPPPEPALVRRLVRYSGWTGTADVVAVLSMHQGVFILTFLGHSAAAGLFGLGLALAQGFSLISTAFNDYVLPRGVRVSSLEALPRFLTRVSLASLVVAIACVPLVLEIGLLVPRALGPELHGVVPIFYCLAASMLLGIVQAPLLAAAHYLQRPQHLMAAFIVRVLITGALGLLFAPRWGAMGAAVAHLAGGLLGTGLRLALVGGTLRAALQEQRHRKG